METIERRDAPRDGDDREMLLELLLEMLLEMETIEMLP